MTTNQDRADRAYRYAHLYSTEVLGEEDIKSAITHLMADLAHLAEEYYTGGHKALSLADLHFTEERNGD